MVQAKPASSTTTVSDLLHCRLCGGGLNQEQQLVLYPAPAGAQHFLDLPDTDTGDSITLAISQCYGCGLVQSVNAPVEYYKSVISAAGLSTAMREFRFTQIKTFAEQFDLVGKRVVEIGCYTGGFLDLFAEVGMKPFGTEWQSAFTTETGCPVAAVYPEPGASIPNAPFSAFFCFNFLEHSPDPRLFLKGIWENLESDAVGLVEVPNYTQQRRLGRVFDYIADHLCYFDAYTLSLTLSLSGFHVETVMETRNGENLEAWVRKRKQIALHEEASEIKATQERLSVWLAQQHAANLRIAVWGASHQSLTLLACLRPQDLVGIFDSAPFKQGRFAPVTRLPILKPSSEALLGVDGVLIVAAGYEREIVAILRNELGFSRNIYCMRKNGICSMEC